jgi:hypothetical protein
MRWENSLAEARVLIRYRRAYGRLCTDCVDKCIDIYCPHELELRLRTKPIWDAFSAVMTLFASIAYALPLLSIRH